MTEWFKRNFGGFAILILPLAVFLSWLSPWEHPKLFCSGDNPCLREWVSALSGWAAAIAAFFTVRKMNQQRADSDKHQRENVEIQIMGRLSIARSMRNLAENIVSRCKFLEGACLRYQRLETFPDKPFSDGVGKIGASILPEPTMIFINNYDKEIGISSTQMAHIMQLSAGLSDWSSIYSEAAASEDVKAGKIALEEVIAFCQQTEFAFTNIEKDAASFIGRWEQKISQP